MKRLLLAVVTSLLVVGWLQGQDRDQVRDQDRIYQHLMLKDGKVYQVHDQDMIQLREQLRLENGCIVNPDGSYQLQNKKQLKLKNGECLDMQGNRYKTQQEFRQQMQYHQQAMAQEHVMFQNGQLYQIRDQQKVQLKEQVKLRDGSAINPDGTWLKRSGDRQQLKNGECMDMEGKFYANQDRFHEKMEQRMSKESQMKMEKGNPSGKKGGTKNN